uniref:Uncharacterized protein n=1 Tax=Laticauda laticaudata TaxID=8630 RepID=A0A8C5S8K0_LATLA
MKTLLLTLVVVAIVYLDLGYTKLCATCVKPFPFKSESRCCSEGHDICYKVYWLNEHGNEQVPYEGKYPVMLDHGCVTACTGMNPTGTQICCPTNCE